MYCAFVGKVLVVERYVNFESLSYGYSMQKCVENLEVWGLLAVCLKSMKRYKILISILGVMI